MVAPSDPRAKTPFGPSLARALALVSLALVTACAQKKPDANLKIRLPSAAASATKISATSINLEGLAQDPAGWLDAVPSDASDLNCYFVIVRGQDDALKRNTCTMADGSALAYGPAAGLAAGGGILEIKVPSGAKREIVVFAMAAAGDAGCVGLASVRRERYSAPLKIGSAIADIQPGDNVVAVRTTIDPIDANRVRECIGGFEASPTPSPTPDPSPAPVPSPSPTPSPTPPGPSPTPGLTVTDAFATEGNDVQFTVSAGSASVHDISFSYKTIDGTAVGGSDYAAVVAGTHTILAGQVSTTVSIPTGAYDDGIYEGEETFHLEIFDPQNATVADNMGVGTIMDDESPPTLSISASPTSAFEGSNFAITINQSGPPMAFSNTVTISTAHGTTDSSDFNVINNAYTIDPLSSKRVLSLVTHDDFGAEPDETLTVIMTNPLHGTMTASVLTLTIRDNDAPPFAPTDVRDGEFLFSRRSPPLTWAMAAQGAHPIAHYEVSIGTAPGGSDIAPWIPVGNVNSHQFATLSGLIDFGRYYASVRAVDSHGNAGPAQTGDGWFVLGAGKVHDMTSGRLSQTAARMGQSIALSEDGSILAVGAPYDDYDTGGGDPITDAGAVFLFTRSGNAWTFERKVVAPAAAGARMAQDLFGSSVALSGDTLVVGAPDQDYDHAGVNSAMNAGAIYVFVRDAGTGDWNIQAKITPAGTNSRMAGDRFGATVAISGETVVSGAPNHGYDAFGANLVTAAGAAYVFTRSGGAWSQQQKLTATGVNARAAADGFGRSIALHSETLVIGAPGQDYDANGGVSVPNAGAAYVFNRSSGFWAQADKLTGFGSNGRWSNAGFGQSVALRDNLAIVGAPMHDFDQDGGASESGAGAAFVFTRDVPNPVFSGTQVLAGSGPMAARMNGDSFGSSVAVAKTTTPVFACGVPHQDSDANGANPNADSGAAFIFH